jgi:predicted enzyme related to lactoylglutathione lyase
MSPDWYRGVAATKRLTAARSQIKFTDMIRFCRYLLRTTNVASARALYAAALGRDDAAIVPLHESALARGARPHWLGLVGVDDVEATAQAFAARGALRLGPTLRAGDGGEFAVVRDPGGAIVGLASPPSASVDTGVVWHTLNANDLPRTSASYCDLFGWAVGAGHDFGALGVFHELAWQPGGAAVGAMCDITGRAGRHPHWLFHFRVAALPPAIAAVRAAGGLVLEPITLPDGSVVAVCDDAEGAAFAITA